MAVDAFARRLLTGVSGYATTAATAATNASNSAATASTHASNAAANATNAATSASNAATSETNAAVSAASAAASYDAFDDRYLGSKAANPTLDNDGNALLTGALYWNTGANEMRVYNGSAWVATYLPASGYATLNGTETLTNKTINLGNNTLTGTLAQFNTAVSDADIMPTSGGTFTGSVTTKASVAGGAGINVPHGTAPTSPTNGDFWSTTAGFYGRVNGVTVGPFGAGGGSPITSSSAQAFAVGQNGNTNPAFNVDASTASSATGVTVKSAAAGGGVNVTATSSGTNESLTINPKGAAILALGTGAGTYAVNIGASSGCYVQTYNLYATNQNGVDHPLRFSQSSLIASPSAGGFEFGSDYCFYATPDAGNRGVIDVKTLTIQQAGYTLTSTTSAQKAFNGSTNGAVTLAVGTYEFEALIVLTGMSATSGSFGFALGGTATFTQSWMSEANKVATLATAGAAQNTLSTAANTTLATANTNTNGYMKITGTIVVTVAGTVIPQVSLGVAAAASVNTGSFFKVRKIGSTSVTTVGNWS